MSKRPVPGQDRSLPYEFTQFKRRTTMKKQGTSAGTVFSKEGDFQQPRLFATALAVIFQTVRGAMRFSRFWSQEEDSGLRGCSTTDNAKKRRAA
jgi:hypothetical protein